MILCFDVGNTDIHGGVYDGGELVAEFRKSNLQRPSTDEFGIFCLELLRAHSINPKSIQAVAIASVVPDCNRIIEEAVEKYLNLKSLILRAGVKTGLKIRTSNPNEVGADRIANAIAAVDEFPNKNLIVVDMGTATTVCAINKSAEYLGGVIAPGIHLGMRALAQNTAKLPYVDLVTTSNSLGKTTIESLQIGLFKGHLGFLKEVIAGLKNDTFEGEPVSVIGTGGNAQYFKDYGLFEMTIPDLVLKGLLKAIELNSKITL